MNTLFERATDMQQQDLFKQRGYAQGFYPKVTEWVELNEMDLMNKQNFYKYVKIYGVKIPDRPNIDEIYFIVYAYSDENMSFTLIHSGKGKPSTHPQYGIVTPSHDSNNSLLGGNSIAMRDMTNHQHMYDFIVSMLSFDLPQDMMEDIVNTLMDKHEELLAMYEELGY